MAYTLWWTAFWLVFLKGTNKRKPASGSHFSRTLRILKAAANFTCQLLMPTCRGVIPPADFSCQLFEGYFTCQLLMSTFGAAPSRYVGPVPSRWCTAQLQTSGPQDPLDPRGLQDPQPPQLPQLPTPPSTQPLPRLTASQDGKVVAASDMMGTRVFEVSVEHLQAMPTMPTRDPAS